MNLAYGTSHSYISSKFVIIAYVIMSRSGLILDNIAQFDEYWHNHQQCQNEPTYFQRSGLDGTISISGRLP